MSDTNYFYGHGRAYGGTRTSAGAVGNYDLNFTEVESLTLNLATDMVEHESKSGSIASVDLRFARKVTITGELVFSIHTSAMLALGWWGTAGTVAGGSFIASAAVFPSGLVVGGRYPIPGNRRNISSLVITDSTGSPVTATLGTHYSADLRAGIITILDLTGLTQPLKAAGSEGAGVSVGGLTQRVYERRLLYSGINLADDDKECSLDLYKIQFDPAKDVQFISSGNEVNKYSLAFSVLKDSAVDPATATGQYFLYKELTES